MGSSPTSTCRPRAPEVYAAGDVANAFHPRYKTRIRLQHWSAALNQGPAAACNMLGQLKPYERTPYFYSDQYEMSLEYRGWAPKYERVVFRGDPTGAEYLVFWMLGDRVVPAMNVTIWDEGDAIEALLRADAPVDASRLADPSVDLASLAPPAPQRPDACTQQSRNRPNGSPSHALVAGFRSSLASRSRARFLSGLLA